MKKLIDQFENEVRIVQVINSFFGLIIIFSDLTFWELFEENAWIVT